jgi:hypothetical protein
MVRERVRWPFGTAFALLTLLTPAILLAGFSVDEDPRETPIDPGDVFLPGPVCDLDDGDGSCPLPSLRLLEPDAFDMDAFAIDGPLPVCPPDPPFPPGVLFSFDDADPGPGLGAPDNSTEIFFYDHCGILGPRRSYNTTITERVLGLGADPPPVDVDDDVDAYDTRPGAPHFEQGGTILFSPDAPSNGGLGAGSEAHVWWVNLISVAPLIWADAALDIGVPDPENCDIDGIAPIEEPGTPWRLLFTTDDTADCGLDPGDIWATDLMGLLALWADDVNDLQIARDEDHRVDIDALAINDGGDFQITDPFDPNPDDTFYKADWPNYAPSGMPDFSQDHQSALWPPPLLGTWCGPTAVADSLWWFDSEMECDLDLTVGQNAESEPNDACDQADRLGERPPIPAALTGAAEPDVDWYFFDIPYKPYRTCTVTVSTCALRNPGDADTVLSLWGACDNVSGTPGDFIALNDDACPTDRQSEITVDLAGGRRYWVAVEPSPVGPGPGTQYTLSLGIDCYPMVQRYPEDPSVPVPSTPDDHSEYNPVRLIPDLARCMNTDDVWSTGSGHRGTRVFEMTLCIEDWLIAKGLRPRYENVRMIDAPPFHTADPDDDDVATEVIRSEDVVLLLGFWWNLPQTDEWIRCGGHYVTVAGVDIGPDGPTVTLSDPAWNNAETGAPGRVRGPAHGDHAPALNPPPDHDDTLNLSHDTYAIGPPETVWADWSIPFYKTGGAPTSCADVERWCSPEFDWQQNPPEPPLPQEPCPDMTWRVSAEVEWMIDVSPRQTPVCIVLDSLSSWPDNVRVAKGNCNPTVETIEKDVIRGKLCNLRFSMLAPQVDLGFVQCLYDNSNLTEFDELSPDDTRCTGGWFYLVRQEGDIDYGQGSPGGEPRIPALGGCP